MKDMSTYHATFVANYRPAVRRMFVKLAVVTVPFVVLFGFAAAWIVP